MLYSNKVKKRLTKTGNNDRLLTRKAEQKLKTFEEEKKMKKIIILIIAIMGFAQISYGEVDGRIKANVGYSKSAARGSAALLFGNLEKGNLFLGVGTMIDENDSAFYGQLQLIPYKDGYHPFAHFGTNFKIGATTEGDTYYGVSANVNFFGTDLEAGVDIFEKKDKKENKAFISFGFDLPDNLF